MTDTTLQEAIGLARDGRKTEARWLLEAFLKKDRSNETAWLWYADCVETVEERVQALERCLRYNPNARMARAGLDLLRSPRAKPETAAGAAAGEAPVGAQARTALVRTALARTASPAPFITELEPAATAGPALHAVDPASLPEEAPVFDSEDAPAFELTEEDEWLLSEGSSVFTVSPEALTPEELAEMAARTEAFLAETRPERPRRPENWQDMERITGLRAPSKRRKTAAETGMSRTVYTTLTALAALAVVMLLVLLLGAAIVLRGV